MTTWHPDTPPWYVETAERVCTPKQLEALKLASHNLTYRQIASILGITRQAADQRHANAIHRIHTHLNLEGDAA